MAGGGPYGFRLLGGDANPLTVSKIRPSSKAQVSGLLEGDVILAINDISCQALSHPTATGLIESNSSGLTVLVLRGRDARSEAPSVISSLGPNVRRLSDEEATALALRHGNQIQTASDSYDANGYSSDGGGGGGGGGAFSFRLSAPPSGDSLKQTRISRLESRSEDRPPPPTTLPPPRIVVVEEAPGPPAPSGAAPPSFYTREEKTSTDGGRTTRIVEEVKTEKIGGTTLTKVTKQEFTSYSSSNNNNSGGGGGPALTYSTLRRSEDRPADNPPARDDGRQVWEDRGWTATTTTTSNVERRSVTAQQPFEGGRIVRVTQEPAANDGWVVYQDGIDGGRGGEQRRVSGQLGGRQAIPAIEIHFEPDERTCRVKTSAVQPAAATADSNITVRVGDEVDFQPKIQIQPAAPWDRQDAYEFQQQQQQQHPPPNLKTYQAPRIEVERKVVSSTGGQQQSFYPGTRQQPSRIEVHCYGPSNQPAGTFSSSSSDRQFQDSGNRGFGYEQNYDEDLHPSRVFHSQPQPTKNPEFLAKSDNYQSYDVIHSQNDHRPQPPPPPHPQTGNNPQEEYHPEDDREYTAVVHNPNHTAKYKPGRTETNDAVNKFNARPTNPYGRETVEEPSYCYSQTGYRPQSQPLHDDRGSLQRPFDREPEERYVPAAQQHGYGTFPGAKYNPGRGKQTETTYYDNEPILPQRLPGTRDVQSKKVTWNQPDSDRFIIPAEVGRPDSADAVRGRPVYPGPCTGRPPAVRQDRVELGTTQKWTPGSKLLPSKQPAIVAREIKGGTAVGGNNYGSSGDPQRRQYGEYEDVYRPPTEEGWYEASAGTAPADARRLPDEVPSRGYEVPSRGYDQKRPGNVRYSWAGYPSDGPQQQQQQQQADWAPQGQGDRRHPGAPNTWKQPPSTEIRGQNLRGYVDEWQGEEPDDVTAMYDAQRDDWGRHQPEVPRALPHPHAPPPPLAPPFVPPGMMTGRPPHPPMFSQPQEPRDPPPPPPPVAPPIDQLKVYRGHASSDGGSYGLTSLEERVKVANSMALSVLAPENRNSRGQKMFIRRRENSHKWTKEGPDPVPEKTQQQQQQHRAAQGQSDPNAAWTPPRFAEQQARPGYPSHHAAPSGPLPSVHHQGTQQESSAYSLADDVASRGGKGGQLFAMRKAKSEKWTSYESPGSQPVHAPSPSVNSPAAGKTYGANPSSYAADQRQSVGINWQPQQQQPAFGSSSYNQGPQTPKLASGLSKAPQSYKTVRFQGAPAAFSPSPGPSYGQPGPRQPPIRFGPKQFGGGSVSVSRSVGFTDL